MPSYSGVWTLTAQYQAIGGQNWPMAPGAPTSVSATGGDSSATVTFVAPSFEGIPPPITGYLATSTPGGFTATGASSPLTITGLTNGTPYTIAVQATNAVGYGPAGTSGSVSPVAPSRGIIYGSTTGGVTNTIQYITIASTGSGTDFGDLTVGRIMTASCASSTRAVCMGGNIGGDSQNIIDYITILSTGNATDFGDLTVIMKSFGAGNNATRGVCAGGYEGFYENTINYITIASTGNAQDFGDLTTARRWNGAVCSPTRTIWGSGYGSAAENVIDYVTTATTGNAVDFGDMTGPKFTASGCSSATRGVFSGGTNNSDGNTDPTNVIQYITMSSTGNSIDFGDLTFTTTQSASCSSPTLGCITGNGSRLATVNTITIATTGNAAGFGDLAQGVANASGTSNGNGGLQ
jgi:hypothetical protein